MPPPPPGWVAGPKSAWEVGSKSDNIWFASPQALEQQAHAAAVLVAVDAAVAQSEVVAGARVDAAEVGI